MISPINHISPIASKEVSGAVLPAEKSSDSMFASVFQNAIDNVKSTETEAVQNQYLMATGQLDNPAVLAISQTKSALAVEMLVQLRNKALDAYSELNRINL